MQYVNLQNHDDDDDLFNWQDAAWFCWWRRQNQPSNVVGWIFFFFLSLAKFLVNNCRIQITVHKNKSKIFFFLIYYNSIGIFSGTGVESFYISLTPLHTSLIFSVS